ncbi:hypothetical protein Y032_0093g2681 [Ancylostoma ceylanicum]|uniref:Uncharacterized protein n=1 Tax=Ancylostoma ceylanicum TaxID=53326 RepID=A0A016TKW7_9BILA|nr:hypothetical protein Y032_0093g2681 [Ancylostoma ceylanicum]
MVDAAACYQLIRTCDKMSASFRFPQTFSANRVSFKAAVGLALTRCTRCLAFDKASLGLEVRLGYRGNTDAADEWHELIATNITRNLECSICPDKKSNGNMYECGVIDLFEMGSNNYPFYLLNICIPINQTACRTNPRSPNCQIGKVTNLRVVTIHQNGGFTLVWLWLKTLLFPAMVAAIWWYWSRVERLARKPLLLEKAIMTLGVSMAILDYSALFFSDTNVDSRDPVQLKPAPRSSLAAVLHGRRVAPCPLSAAADVGNAAPSSTAVESLALYKAIEAQGNTVR